MRDNCVIFTTPERQELRVVFDPDGTPFFCGPDLAAIAGYEQPRKAVTGGNKGVNRIDSVLRKVPWDNGMRKAAASSPASVLRTREGSCAADRLRMRRFAGWRMRSSRKHRKWARKLRGLTPDGTSSPAEGKAGAGRNDCGSPSKAVSGAGSGRWRVAHRKTGQYHLGMRLLKKEISKAK